jgi:hypothetical protein
MPVPSLVGDPGLRGPMQEPSLGFAPIGDLKKRSVAETVLI